MTTPSVTERITAYLCGGGLFNPEYANHDAVRDLLIDAKSDLAARDAELASVKAERDALKRVHDDIMQAVDECGSYKP